MDRTRLRLARGQSTAAASLGLWLAVLGHAAPALGASCETLRPTDALGADGISYGDAEVLSFAWPEGRARVFYATSGSHAPSLRAVDGDTPDVVRVAATAAEEALARYMELGFDEPPSDAASSCPSNGGDGRTDVYLVDLASTADGKAVADDCELLGGVRRCSGFVLVDNDFRQGGYASVAEGLRTVVPHELFHLVQNGYAAGTDRWWLEGTAQWAAKRVYPELTDLERHLPSFFRQTWRSIDVPPAGVVASYLYATAIWPQFLSERHGDALVRRIFEAERAEPQSALAAAEQVLAQDGSSLADEFLLFAAYNAATGSRAAQGSGYAAAAAYPLVEVEPFSASPGTSVTGVLAGFGVFYYEVMAGPARVLELEAEASRVQALFLPSEASKVRVDRAQALPTTTTESGILVVSGQSAAKTDAAFVVKASAVDSAKTAANASCNSSRHGHRASSSRGASAWISALSLLLALRAVGRRRSARALASRTAPTPEDP